MIKMFFTPLILILMSLLSLPSLAIVDSSKQFQRAKPQTQQLQIQTQVSLHGFHFDKNGNFRFTTIISAKKLNDPRNQAAKQQFDDLLEFFNKNVILNSNYMDSIRFLHAVRWSAREMRTCYENNDANCTKAIVRSKPLPLIKILVFDFSDFEKNLEELSKNSSAYYQQRSETAFISSDISNQAQPTLTINISWKQGECFDLTNQQITKHLQDLILLQRKTALQLQSALKWGK